MKKNSDTNQSNRNENPRFPQVCIMHPIIFSPLLTNKCNYVIRYKNTLFSKRMSSIPKKIPIFILIIHPTFECYFANKENM